MYDLQSIKRYFKLEIIGIVRTRTELSKKLSGYLNQDVRLRAMRPKVSGGDYFDTIYIDKEDTVFSYEIKLFFLKGYDCNYKVYPTKVIIEKF